MIALHSTEEEPLPPVRRKLVELVDYVSHLARLAERPVLKLESYGQPVFHEIEFRDRVGIHHDEADDDGPIWLTIDRLQRADPPTPEPLAKPWLTVARDPFKEPGVASLRHITVSREEAERLVADGRAAPDDVLDAVKPVDGLPLDGCRDVMLPLKRQPEEQAAVCAYVDGPWRSWAESEKPRRQTIALYERLFSLTRLLQNDTVERPLELLWGIGLARWTHEVAVVDHPIVEQLVELELDERAALLVRPRIVAPRLHLQPFEALQIDGAATVRRDAHAFLEAATTPPLSPFDRTSFEPVLRLAVQWLDAKARYWPDVADDKDDRTPPPADTSLTVTDGWVLYARPRSENVYAQDLERLKASIRHAEELPVAAVRLVEEPSDEPRPFRGGSGPTGPRGTGDPDTEPLTFYFPKAFNSEQMEIVRRLERADGLVVQGPPGTGKTHTIANIVCHYLATGRRVLVTSKGEAALTVLREHFPEAIRDLVISLLTSEREGMRQLERAVSILANKLVQMDPTGLARGIEEVEARLAKLQGELDATDRQLAAFAEKHLRPIDLGDGRSLLPAEVARSLVEDRERHAWLPDRPGSGIEFEPTLDDAMLADLRVARRRLGQDLKYVGADLPSLADLPEVARLLTIHRGLAERAAIESEARARAFPHLVIDVEHAVERATHLADRLQVFLGQLGHVENTPWARALARRLEERGTTANAERGLLQEKVEELELLVARRAELLRHAIDIPEDAELNDALLAAVQRARDRRRPFALFGGLLDKATASAKRTIASIRVDGRAPDGPADWGMVAAELGWRREVRALAGSWPCLASLGVPSLPEKTTTAGELEGLARLLRSALTLPAERTDIAQEIERLFPADRGLVTSLLAPGKVRELVETLGKVVRRHQLHAYSEARHSIVKKLSARRGSVAETLSYFFQECIGNPEADEHEIIAVYERLRREIERQRGLEGDLETVRQGAALVEGMGAPKWAAALCCEPATGEVDPWTPADWRASWDWWRRDAYLREIDGRQHIRELSERRLALEDELRRLFQDVVRDRTYLRLKSSLSHRVLAGLHKFVVAIRKIGKGTGKSAGRYRGAAREAMADAAGAVPCWIMPHWRIAESLPPRLGDFDLVIVDEASQSDLFALPAILRGKKLLVVGDDKQVSPTAAFIEERQLVQLRESLLGDQYFKDLMLPGNSLYDLAGALFPGDRLMLREHFRCVEPIIRFSMQFYDAPDGGEPLHAVRVPTAAERLDPPLVAIHVPHGRKTRGQTNRAEAEVIVEEVARLIEAPDFGDRSIGIVSLIGAHQAQLVQTMLLERLGETPFLRHQIACGDSATFQGKERDVMFVSMVECPHTSTAKTATMFQQRFNVALSRARDQMILVHSVTEDQLKPDDLKAKVLRHFRDPMAGKVKLADDPFSLCQSEFERDVLRRLVAPGFHAIPQVTVGPYAIDIVIEGAQGRRLAVELDGDRWHGPGRWQEDLVRQRVLERCGWRFWRCWASSFAMDPEGCMADLRTVLARLGIEPTGEAWQPPVFTEFRTAPAPQSVILEPDVPPAEEAAPSSPPEPERPSELRPPAAATVAGTSSKTTGAEAATVDIGDRFVIAYTHEPNRQLTLTMTASDHRPEVGLVAASHVIFRQFLGAAVDEQLEIVIEGNVREAVILAIDKALPARRAA